MPVVLVGDAGTTRSGQLMAVDLAQPGVGVADDDKLVAHHLAPHLGPLTAVGGRVAHRAETDRLVGLDPSSLAQRRGMRRGGQHVQPGPLLSQRLRRHPPGGLGRGHLSGSPNARRTVGSMVDV
ncbi:MAG TPA: hypothetical protein VLL25_17830 [Acidimicrobiales bacterium]|nr:hypothetical protein [Acidimicrobiales bacterium]